MLRHYFESYTIAVVINYPLKSVLRKPDLTGRLGKWNIYVSSYDVVFKSRTMIKLQVLADFVADFSPELEELGTEETLILATYNEQPWTLFVDGSSNIRGVGLGVVLKSPQGGIMVHSISCDFKATNNEAEYEALIAGMKLAHDLGATHLHARSDSLLVVKQVNGEFATKDSKMTAYIQKVKREVERFNSFDIWQIPRDQNFQADALANLGFALRKLSFDTIPIIHQENLSIESNEQILVVDENNDDDYWAKEIKEYLMNNRLPDDKMKARQIRFKSSKYIVIPDKLYRRSSTDLNLWCVVRS